MHGAAGIWGVVAVGLFDLDLGMAYDNDFDKVMEANLKGIGANAPQRIEREREVRIDLHECKARTCPSRRSQRLPLREGKPRGAVATLVRLFGV